MISPYVYPGLIETPSTLSDLDKFHLVVGIVCEYFTITTEQLKIKRRKHEIVYPRQITIHLAKRYTEFRDTEIGLLLGGFERTSVYCANEKILERYEVEESVQNEVEALSRAIEQQIKIQQYDSINPIP